MTLSPVKFKMNKEECEVLFQEHRLKDQDLTLHVRISVFVHPQIITENKSIV